MFQPSNRVAAQLNGLREGYIKSRRLGVHPVVNRWPANSDSVDHFFYADQSRAGLSQWWIHSVTPCMFAAAHSFWMVLNGVARFRSYKALACKKKQVFGSVYHCFLRLTNRRRLINGLKLNKKLAMYRLRTKHQCDDICVIIVIFTSFILHGVLHFCVIISSLMPHWRGYFST